MLAAMGGRWSSCAGLTLLRTPGSSMGLATHWLPVAKHSPPSTSPGDPEPLSEEDVQVCSLLRRTWARLEMGGLLAAD